MIGMLPRDVYLEREFAKLPFNLKATRLSGGYAIGDRPYVALRCHCATDTCPGFAMVHDHPDDRAHFQRLFGAKVAPEPAPQTTTFDRPSQAGSTAHQKGEAHHA